MKILALIPARGGSKRIPGKNIRLLGGQPLIAWSIDVAQKIPEVCEILVSTDDAAIASIARDAGATVPWLRPAELATDTATSAAVALHALDWYEAGKGVVDGLLLLQPTAPFRTAEMVRRGCSLFTEHRCRAVVGFSPAKSHPLWCFRVEGTTVRPFVAGAGLHLRSQELPPAHVVNGAFYLIAPNELRRHKSFFTDDIVPLLCEDPGEHLDLDTEEDWQGAEIFLAARNGTRR